VELTPKQRAILRDVKDRARKRERARHRYREAGEPGKPPAYTAWSGHHFYWGGIVLFLGFLCIFHGPLWLTLPLLAVGLHWIVDDIAQHIHQGHDFLWWKKNPDYISPVHLWYWAVVTWFLVRAEPNSAWSRLLMWLRRH